MKASDDGAPRLITRKSLLFLAIVFLVNWAGIWIAAQGPALLQPLRFAAFFSPAIAALACVFAFERGRRLQALGLNLRLNWWWLWALLIAIGVPVVAALITALFSPHRFLDLDGMARQVVAQGYDGRDGTAMILLKFVGTMGVYSVLLTFFILGEELGWRGYLYDLWRRIGFWRYSFISGFIWGLWHLPANYLFLHLYPDRYQILGLFLFTLFTTLFAPLMTLMRDRGHSLWPVCILHGAFDGVAGLAVVMVDDPQFPWTITGISGLASLALWLALVPLLRRGDGAAA